MDERVTIMAGLTRAEVIAIRLATGPMLDVYNRRLHALMEGAEPVMPHRSTYSTTMHAVVSAMNKLSAASQVSASTYVGIGGLMLPGSLCLRGSEGGRQGCEAMGFISATTACGEAAALSDARAKHGLPPAVLELQMGYAVKGASVGFMSQDPQGLRQVLIPPLCYIELLDNPRLDEAPHGREVLVLPSMLRIVALDTVQDSCNLRKRMHMQAMSHMHEEVKRDIFEIERGLKGREAQVMRENMVVESILSEIEGNLRNVREGDCEKYREDAALATAMEETVDIKRLALVKYQICLEHVARGSEGNLVLETILETPVEDLKQLHCVRKLRSGVWDFPWQSVCKNRKDEVRIPLNLEVWQVSMVWECLMEVSETVKRVKFGGVVLTQWSKPTLRLPNSKIGLPGAKIVAGLLSNMTSLTTICIPGNGIGPVGGLAVAKALAGLKRLTEIDLSDNKMSGGDMIVHLCSAIQNNLQLVNVDLRNNDFSFEDGLAVQKAVRECPNILLLSGLPISDLRKKNLVNLDLSAPSFGVLEAAISIRKVHEHGTLTYLNLVGCKIGHAGALSLISMLEANSTIAILDVRENDLSYDDGLLFLPVLRGEACTIKTFSGLPIVKLCQGTMTEFSLRSMCCGPAEGAIAVAYLPMNTQLTKLSLFGVRIGDKGLRDLLPMLKDMSQLELLDLRENDLGSQHAAAIYETVEQLPALKQLCGMPYMGLRSGTVKRCVLKDLSCGEAEGKMLLTLLRNNTSLTHMDMRGISVGDEGIADITAFVQGNTELKLLDLRDNELSYESGHVFRTQMPASLEVVSAVPVMNMRKNAIKELILKDLDIGAFGGSIAVGMLGCNTSITCLSLLGVKLGPWAMEGIVQFLKATKVLSTLDVRGNNFSLAHGFELLDAIGARRTEIKSLSLIPLAGTLNNTVGQLNFKASQIGPCEIAVICEALKMSTAVRALDLSDNGHFGVEAVACLTEALGVSKCLAEIDLRGNALSAQEGETLMLALSDGGGLDVFCGVQAKKLRNGLLNEVDLYAKKIGPMEGVALGKMLIGFGHVETLDLTRNALGPSGMQALAPCFEHLKSLLELGLGCNGIGESGAHALAAGLQHLISLERLYVYENDLGPEGCAAVAGGLKGTVKLKQLYLSYNRMGDLGCSALCEALPLLSQIESIGLQNNAVGLAGWTDFATALATLHLVKYVNLQGHGLEGEDMTAVAGRIRQAMRPPEGKGISMLYM